MRPLCRKWLLPLIACLALIMLPASKGISQDAKPETTSGAIKFDEFERLGGCNFGARLDNFAITLSAQAGVEGYVISYGPEGKGSGTGNYNLQVIENYLVNGRGIEKERFKTIYGGRYKDQTELATELWIAPIGAEPPQPKRYKDTRENFTGKFCEFEVSDRWAEADGGTGPYSGDPTLANFADTLRRQPETRAYIIVYSTQDAATGAWRRVAKHIANNLENDYGVHADRIKMIFAGYEKSKEAEEYDPETKVQLWVLPDGTPPPVKEGKAERRPKQAVQIGTFYNYSLSDPSNVKRIFEGFADVLRADEQLRTCVIVRPSIDPPNPEAGPNEPPDIDLLQLVEKWKTDLAKSYKIDEGRLIITVAAATEDFSGGTLETWIVPPDATLPDPYPPQEDTGETEEENPQSLEASPQSL